MRSRKGHVAFIVAMTVVLLCADGTGGWAPGLAANGTMPAVRIAEFHYDNSGTDTGEAIEITGPAGTDLTDWRVVLYNGANSAVYNTAGLSGTIPATCGAHRARARSGS
jgi:5'-nucleotidase